MKKFITYIAVFGAAMGFFSCSSDDSTTPVVNPPEPPPVVTPEEEKLTLEANENTIYIGDEITFTAKVGEKEITEVTIKQSNGTTITDNKWIATEAGEFTFIATKKGYVDSDPITIKVDVDSKPNGQGYFKHKGTTYNIDVGEIFFDGFFDLDEEDENSAKVSSWTVRHTDLKTNYIIYFMFFAPAILQEDETYKYVLPNTENIESPTIMVGEIDSDGQIIIKDFITSNLNYNLNIGKMIRKDIYNASVKISTPANSAQEFNLEYTGEYYFPQED
ncbi:MULTISPECIES: hypothetical protein [Myroides]|uniref:Lipoprotein n=1 Tax=Myroides albus TaxID=2562892 RepID=A0A6I3LM90_9FLAO|nr:MULTISPECIES: hypothetical protein [Myroides]MTG98984.1 hypothetical protein [Myroides albus]MVX35782.1 hypothetical protein [Myroides sp. LoEW2-1]UVD78264.1 hypothetical protein NWE55_08935 [Myroides albus]